MSEREEPIVRVYLRGMCDHPGQHASVFSAYGIQCLVPKCGAIYTYMPQSDDEVETCEKNRACLLPIREACE